MFIEYGYDGVRLVSIKYPDMPSDSVTYIYGDSTATDKSRGRLIEVKDASGTEGYTYGIMGEVIKTERTINIDTLSHTVHSYEYEAEYDSWGRVRTMTYPDGEMVTYTYYNTGELHSVIGTTEEGAEDKYLDRAGYDPYGRTIYRKLGNGTENFYTYDNNERLESSTLKNDGNIISTNTYRYDATDNITGIRGISESAYNQEYNYDDLNRLISASGMATEGKSDDGSEFNAYTMNMDYNLMSSPLNYELAIMNPTGTKLTNFDYLYGTDIQPNAPIKVGDMTYTYDASGNPVTIDGEEVGRSMIYDSDNRLREIMDYRKNIMSRYTYNHTGERAVKRYGAFESMAVNGAPAGSKLDANAKYSAYVSPYYVENGSGTKSGAFSKHYYAGNDRIASKTADDAYFYFTDHLGSTTHITDRSGAVAQYAAYTPYGSLFREYRSVQPYKFNGKELDQETGYYYYGARYYDQTTALWLGTDPLKHKYPDIGAYVYCAGNPVRYVDSDGRETRDALSNPSRNYFQNRWSFYKEVYKATTVTVSAGLQAGAKFEVAGKSVGVQANLVSGEVDVLDKGKLSINNSFITQGAEISIGVAGVGIEKSVKDNGNRTATKTETFNGSVFVVESGVRTTTEHVKNRNGTYTQISKKIEVVEPSITLKVKAQVLIGVEAKIDIAKVWQAFKDFTKNTFNPY